jgi:hypothetical protein
MAYPGTRLVIELEGREEPIATPYFNSGWLVGSVALLALLMQNLRRLASFWVAWRGSLRRLFPRVFAGNWDERWLDPVAEWLAGRTGYPVQEVKEALRDPVVAAAATTSHHPEVVVSAVLCPQEQLLQELLREDLTPAERQLVSRLLAKYAPTDLGDPR